MTIKIMKRTVSGSIISNYGRFLVAFWEVSGSIPLCFPHDSYWEAGGWGESLRWPGGGLDRSYSRGTTRELPGNYPGFGLAALGYLAWLSRPGKSLAS